MVHLSTLTTSRTMPAFTIGETVAICDLTGEHIGDLRIYELRVGAWCGTFCPMPAYDRVRYLFAKHAKLVTTQNLSFIDEAVEKIADLGLWARIGSERLEIRDVQIYENADGIGGGFREVP
jgi:hypothetical protein